MSNSYFKVAQERKTQPKPRTKPKEVAKNLNKAIETFENNNKNGLKKVVYKGKRVIYPKPNHHNDKTSNKSASINKISSFSSNFLKNSQ